MENALSQVYDLGKAYPQVIRENVLDLYNGHFAEGVLRDLFDEFNLEYSYFISPRIVLI